MDAFTASSATTDGLTYANNTNTTAEGSTSPPLSGNVILYQTPLLLLLSIFGTFANVLVVLVIIRNKKLHRPANYYILSAAVNDALCCLIVDNGLNVLYTYQRWPFGYVTCVIWTIFYYGTSTSSVYHITLLAWDRYEAIVTPYKYYSPRKMIRVAVSISVTYTFSFGVILIHSLTAEKFYSNGYCYFDSEFYWINTVLDLVPFIFIPYFYSGCLIGMRRQFKKLHPLGVSIIVSGQRIQPVTTWRQVTSVLSNLSSFDGLKKTAGTSRLRSDDVSDQLPNIATAPATDVVTVDASEESRNPAEVKLASTSPNVNGQSSRTTQSNPIQQPQTNDTAAYRRHQKHYRQLRTLTILVASHLLLWGPYIGCEFFTLIRYDNWNAMCTTLAGDDVIYLGVFIQQAINPVLVIAAQSEFRQAVWSLFRGRGELQ